MTADASATKLTSGAMNSELASARASGLAIGDGLALAKRPKAKRMIVAENFILTDELILNDR